ncbi:M23 family metallopeptidase [Nocardioides salsibiostraticola]
MGRLGVAGLVGGAVTLSLVVVGTVATAKDEPQPVSAVAAPAAPAAERPVARAAIVGVRVPTVSRASVTRVAATSPVLLRAERSRAEALGRLDVRAGRRTEELEADERAKQRAEAKAAAEAEAAAAAMANLWTLPVASYQITARFGQTSYLWSTVHTGVDLAAPTGTPVVSAAAGVVTSSGYDGSYGNKVVVQHSDGTETWYAHLDSISAGVGEQLASGQALGTVGSTGNVTGPHLHLEVRPGGSSPVDPLIELRKYGLVFE